MTPGRPRTTLLPAVLLAALAALAAPRAPARAEAAGPVAPPPRAEPKSIDEWLAFVEGEYVTRRMIEREIGPRAEDVLP